MGHLVGDVLARLLNLPLDPTAPLGFRSLKLLLDDEGSVVTHQPFDPTGPMGFLSLRLRLDSWGLNLAWACPVSKTMTIISGGCRGRVRRRATS